MPVLDFTLEEAARGKCTGSLACETECVLRGNKGAFIDLPIEGLGS